jgi:hypothetical protein
MDSAKPLQGGGLFKDPKIQFFNLGLQGGDGTEEFKRKTLPGLMEMTGHLYQHLDDAAIVKEVQEEMMAEANLLQAHAMHVRLGGKGSLDELPNGNLVGDGMRLGRAIDILKVDIEGWEWSVLDSLFRREGTVRETWWCTTNSKHGRGNVAVGFYTNKEECEAAGMQWVVCGARFSTENYTRECHWFPCMFA